MASDNGKTTQPPPASGKWDENRTHRAGFLNPIGAFTRLVPRSINHALAVGLGSILAYTMTRTRRVIRHNLTRVGRGTFPEAKVSRLTLQTFHNYARYLVDFMTMLEWDLEYIPKLFRRFTGREAFDRALTRGKGIILVTPHLGNWELGGAFLSAHGFPVNVVSLVTPDAETVAMRETIRERLGIRHIYMGEEESPLRMLGILNALRRNEIVAMLCDRDSTSSPTTVDLFGFPFNVPTGPAVLAQLTGATILPSFIVRQAGQYEAFVGKPILVENTREEEREAEVQARTEEMIREFEKVISRFPDQWYNFFPSWVPTDDGGNGRNPR